MCYMRTGPKGQSVMLRAVAAVLGNAGGSTATAVYTPARSRTAFILAMACVRAAYTLHVIW